MLSVLKEGVFKLCCLKIRQKKKRKKRGASGKGKRTKKLEKTEFGNQEMEKTLQPRMFHSVTQ